MSGKLWNEPACKCKRRSEQEENEKYCARDDKERSVEKYKGGRDKKYKSEKPVCKSGYGILRVFLRLAQLGVAGAGNAEKSEKFCRNAAHFFFLCYSFLTCDISEW